MSKSLELALTAEAWAKDTPRDDAPIFVAECLDIAAELRRLGAENAALRKENNILKSNEVSIVNSNIIGCNADKSLFIQFGNDSNLDGVVSPAGGSFSFYKFNILGGEIIGSHSLINGEMVENKKYTQLVSENDALTKERDALRAQLAQGEPVAEFNGENIRFIPFNGSPLPLTGYLYAAPQQAQGEPVYQWREIGEGDWTNCTKEWYDHASKSPELDTRIVDAPQQAPAVPEGYQLVPIVINKKMWAAINKHDDECYAGGNAHGASFESLWDIALEAAKDGEA